MTVTFMVRCFTAKAQKSVAVSSQNTVARISDPATELQSKSKLRHKVKSGDSSGNWFTYALLFRSCLPGRSPQQSACDFLFSLCSRIQSSASSTPSPNTTNPRSGATTPQAAHHQYSAPDSGSISRYRNGSRPQSSLVSGYTAQPTSLHRWATRTPSPDHYTDDLLLQLHQMWHTRSISTMPIPYQDGACLPTTCM
jgi:hypothetical protein